MAPMCGDCGGVLLYDVDAGGWWTHGHDDLPAVRIFDSGTGGPAILEGLPPTLHVVRGDRWTKS
jgi:hypothetical protein